MSVKSLIIYSQYLQATPKIAAAEWQEVSSETKHIFKEDWFKKYGNKCPLCHTIMIYESEKYNSNNYATIEHVIPKKFGIYAPSDRSNWAVICRKCQYHGSDISQLATTIRKIYEHTRQIQDILPSASSMVEEVVELSWKPIQLNL